MYGGEASCKFSLVGRLNINYPVETARERNFNAQGVFYLNQDKYDACKDLLLSKSYTHHVGTTNSSVTYTDPPARILRQTKCEPTPAADIFTVDDLERISDEGSVLSTRKFQASSLPKFVSFSKVFLAACALCLFHSDGICATLSLLPDSWMTIRSVLTA